MTKPEIDMGPYPGLDPARLADAVLRVPALMRVMGLRKATELLSAVAVGEDDVETAFVLDIIRLALPAGPDREAAWARMNDFLDMHQLDRIVVEEAAPGED